MNQEQTAHESGHTTSGGTSGGEKMNAADAPAPSAAEATAAVAACTAADASSAATATANKSNGTTGPTSDDANESGGAPVPDDKKGQTGKADTAAATKAGAGATTTSTSVPADQDDRGAAKKPKYAIGQAIEKVSRIDSIYFGSNHGHLYRHIGQH